MVKKMTSNQINQCYITMVIAGARALAAGIPLVNSEGDIRFKAFLEAIEQVELYEAKRNNPSIIDFFNFKEAASA